MSLDYVLEDISLGQALFRIGMPVLVSVAWIPKLRDFLAVVPQIRSLESFITLRHMRPSLTPASPVGQQSTVHTSKLQARMNLREEGLKTQNPLGQRGAGTPGTHPA